MSKRMADYTVHQSFSFKICCALVSIMILGYNERSVIGDQ